MAGTGLEVSVPPVVVTTLQGVDTSTQFTDEETRVLVGKVTFLRPNTGATLLVCVEVGS